MTQSVLEFLRADHDNALGRLHDLLAIPSVSTDPAYKPGIERAAQWIADALTDVGLKPRIMPTGGHPVVVARTTDADVLDPRPGLPRVLFYGHYDVQPPDPLDKWITPPFEPTVRDGAIYARGSSDDKGQVLCFLEALRAWKSAAGKLPVHVTVLIEGEEEMGSVNLHHFLHEHRDLLQADIALVSDTAMWDRQTPAITYGLRGLMYFDVQLHGPRRDLHSGVFGGILANPAVELTAVLGRLFDADHRVTVPGFYDDVQAVSDEERAQWDLLGFDEREFLGAVGVTVPHGEAGYGTLERRWARPSCDINGLFGGYGGPGAKTVLPSFAGAKVSFRLAPNQDPRKIGPAFEQWLRGQDVHGCRWQITDLGGADPVVVPSDSRYMRAAAAALELAAGRKAMLIREGATIPVVSDFKKALGIDTLLIGFGLHDDALHSPNEKFDLGCFALGCRAHALVLHELSK